ncbi:MAG: hypothetical protein LBI40_03255 [Treponema sp.]|nr:hypothetical protein [Treponema sp.]
MAPSVSVGEEIAATLRGFIDEFGEGADSVRLGDIFSGKLDFRAEPSPALGVVKLNITPSTSPITIDKT